MKRLVFETALVIGVLVLGLEAVHYREAVLDANVDRKRAWNTVRELRAKCEQADLSRDSSAKTTAATSKPAQP